jgi:hypothetical protein
MGDKNYSAVEYSPVFYSPAVLKNRLGIEPKPLAAIKTKAQLVLERKTTESELAMDRGLVHSLPKYPKP